MTLLKKACFAGIFAGATLWHAGCVSTAAEAGARRTELESFTKFVQANRLTAIIQVDSDGKLGVYQTADVGLQVPLKWHATVFNNPYGATVPQDGTAAAEQEELQKFATAVMGLTQPPTIAPPPWPARPGTGIAAGATTEPP